MQDRPTKTTPDLFTPIAIGPLALPNRIAMRGAARRKGTARLSTAAQIRATQTIHSCAVSSHIAAIATTRTAPGGDGRQRENASCAGPSVIRIGLPTHSAATGKSLRPYYS